MLCHVHVRGVLEDLKAVTAEAQQKKCKAALWLAAAPLTTAAAGVCECCRQQWWLQQAAHCVPAEYSLQSTEYSLGYSSGTCRVQPWDVQPQA